MAKDKPLAVYGEKAMKAEADETASIKLMEKKIAEEKAKERAKTPKEKVFKPAPETEKLTKKLAKGGSAKSASARADGCAVRGKTRAR